MAPFYPFCFSRFSRVLVARARQRVQLSPDSRSRKLSLRREEAKEVKKWRAERREGESEEKVRERKYDLAGGCESFPGSHEEEAVKLYPRRERVKDERVDDSEESSQRRRIRGEKAGNSPS